MSEKKETDSTFGITLTNSKYIVIIFCKEYHEDNANLLTQRKPVSCNQCRYFTLKLIKPNWPISVQLFDWPVTARKVAVILSLQRQCRHHKQSSKWPSPALMHAERQRCHWCTAAAMTAWSSLAHSVLMRCSSSSRSVMHVSYTFSCTVPHTM